MEEDWGMLMSSVYIVITCVGRNKGKSGQWGLGNGTRNGAVDSEHGASKGRGSQLCKKEPPFQGRRLFID
jgi:hypothetical protein